ncbi:PaaX family transcriptional regulator C-terminal domain-containing protein [Streptomyces sp. NPDC090106]|uniref:PaaX family transcriptional regulator n=1 Tax=Streptomyces sp. NPDC090106 TaxID=3365946 RepID=UPI00382387AD
MLKETPRDERGIPAPMELAMDLLGLHVFGYTNGLPANMNPLPTRVFLSALGGLGVSDAAVRTTLNRMVARGNLERRKAGRTSAFIPTGLTLAMLQRGRDRMFSERPFDHEGDVWTILNCPIPETLRNLRYQLQARLVWSGFGMLQPNFWVAPGRVDVEALLGDIVPEPGLVRAFIGAPTPPDSPEQLVEAGWDVDALRAAHHRFAARWSAARPQADEALSQYLLLIDDWGLLLRTDPGLAAAINDPTWPAPDSARIFRQLRDKWGPLASSAIAGLTGSPVQD